MRAIEDASAIQLPSLEEIKRLHVEDVLRACNGNQTEAARRLGINRKTVARFVARTEPASDGERETT